MYIFHVYMSSILWGHRYTSFASLATMSIPDDGPFRAETCRRL